MGHKRSGSHLSDGNAGSLKHARKEATSPPSDALGSAHKRIKDLEHQIVELHAFINANGLTRKAPKSIRKYLEQDPNAASIIAAQIEEKATEVCDELFEQDGITSDDMSEAMMPYLAEVEDVRKLPNGTSCAFDLVMKLAEFSYSDLDSDGGGGGQRPSDEVVDDLLSDLAPERRASDPSWEYSRVLKGLETRAQELSINGIKDFCASTIKLMSEWKISVPS